MSRTYRARKPPYRREHDEKRGRLKRRMLLWTIQGFKGVKKVVTFLFLFVVQALSALAIIFFRFCIVPVYVTVYWVVKRIRRTLPRDTTFPIALATRRTLPVIAGIIIIAAHATHALTSRQISPEQFGHDTILFDVSAGEFVEEFEEIVISEIPEKTERRLEEFAGVTRPLTIREEAFAPEQLSAIAAGDTAVLKPAIGTEITRKTRTDVFEYEVQAGDTASSIAAKFGVSINTVLWENNLSARTLLRPGQKLRVLPTSGVMHIVKSGQTLAQIAKLYSVNSEEILRANNLEKPEEIQRGQKLIVPGGSRIVSVAPRTAVSRITARYIPQAPAGAPGGRLLWPTTARHLTQYYGWRHTGVDIGGPMGTPLFAAEEGVVISAKTGGWNGGYGLMVIIDHGGGMQTLYGHASKVMVVTGQHVAKGETIALMGSTGRSTGPHIHFEVRINGRRVNPLNYIR